MSPTPAASMPNAAKPGGATRRPTRSRGIELPDLVGRPAAGSVAELRKLGLKPNSVPEPVTDPGQAGLVIAQDPPAGEFVPANTRVRIEIGDHSLFDPRKYLAPPPQVAEVRELIPPIPTPFELLSYGEPNPWMSDEEPRGSIGVDEPLGQPPAEDGLWSRWPECGGGYDLQPAEDPFAGEEYPSPEPETGGLPHSIPDNRDDSLVVATYAPEPRWTSRQRRRLLLSLGLLMLLVGLTLATHFGAHSNTSSHSKGAGKSSVVSTRVVTVTVTAPPALTSRSDGS